MELAIHSMHTGGVIRYHLFRSFKNCDAHMSPQNVFIFWVSPMFYEFVSWLIRHPSINLIGSSSNYDSELTVIADKRPDIILIEDTEVQLGEMVKRYLDTIPSGLQIILLSFSDNKLNIYNHEERTMVQDEDLVNLILEKSH